MNYKYIYARRRLTIRSYPVVAWFLGAMFVLPIASTADSWGMYFGIIGLGACVCLGLFSVTTIIADKARATLTIERRYLFVPVRRAYPFAEIADVQLVTTFSPTKFRHRWRRRSGQIFDYRVVVVLTSGGIVHLPIVFSWDYLDHAKLAQHLGNFIKVPRG